MALDAATTLVVGAGNYFTAPAGEAKPTGAALASPTTPWENLGHSSPEEILNIASEGGDVTTLRSLQNSALRTSRTPVTESFGLNLLQWTEQTLKLYYGSNATVDAGGAVQVPTNPTPTNVAFLAVFTDGANQFDIYAPSVEISRGDDIDLSDTESLASIPLQIRPLAYQTNTWTYAVSPVRPIPTGV